MVKHGSSHGLAVLACTVLASLLVDLLRPYYPDLIRHLSKISDWIIGYIPVPFGTEQFNVIIVASILAVIWGVFFKITLKKDT